MDKDREALDEQRNDDTDDNADRVEVAPGGLLAGNIAAANMASGTVGALGGGALGALAAGETLDDDAPQDERLIEDALEQPGSLRRETGDQGVSSAQKEMEASELNG